MILLFAVDKNWQIGYQGDLLVKISEDLKRFRRHTTGNIIIMGRKTFESLPRSEALPNRINIVMTRDLLYAAPNILVVHSVPELFALLEEINPRQEMRHFLIGGGNIALSLMEYCHQAYITKIDKAFEKTDTSMPNLDLDPSWKVVWESETYWQDDLAYRYVNYKRGEDNDL